MTESTLLSAPRNPVSSLAIVVPGLGSNSQARTRLFSSFGRPLDDDRINDPGTDEPDEGGEVGKGEDGHGFRVAVSAECCPHGKPASTAPLECKAGLCQHDAPGRETCRKRSRPGTRLCARPRNG